jgi:hypothetical protein
VVNFSFKTLVRHVAVGAVALAGMAAFASPMAAASTVEPRDPTALAVTASPNPAPPATAVTLNATLVCTGSGAATPTGQVNFSEGATPLGSDVTATNTGTDTWAYSFTVPAGVFAPGSHTITATYTGGVSGGTVTCSAVSATTTLVVTTTTVGVSTSPASPNVGQLTTLQATETCTGDGAPTGTVQFLVDGVPVGGPVSVFTTPPNTGTASTPFVFNTAGTHTVTANYTSTNPLCANSSGSATVTVGGVTPPVGTSTTTLVPAFANPFFLTPVTFTATVACTSGTPVGGSVTFTDNGTPFATVPVTGSGTTGTATTSRTFFFGTHLVVATFNGTATCSGSTSAPSVVVPTFFPFSGTAGAPGQQQVAGFNGHAAKGHRHAALS